jgi:F-type H+-transporting ATPase subunit a
MSLFSFPLHQIATDPIHQFKINRLLEWHPFGLDLSFTNSSFYMMIGVGAALAFLWSASSKGSLIPSRVQSLGEMSYEFISDMVKGSAGDEGMKFFPFVFTLFFFILAANFTGMIPYAFTTTSHLAVTGALAVLVILIVLGYGLYKNGFGFFKLFAPSGVPWYIMPILVPIEIISFLARPVTLGMRLFANMLAGHIMLKLLAIFTVTLVGAAGALKLLAPLPFLLSIPITALEFLVAFLQAYVFALLTCVYLNDAIHPGH